MPNGVATRASWKTTPLSAERARLDYTERFSREEHARIVRGMLPEAMEDKWFIFHEDGWVFFHRSWTGLCVYAVKLRDESDGWVVDEAWVTRDKEQYRETDDAYDAEVLAFLIDRLLLARRARFPTRARVEPEKRPLVRQAVVGDARANDEE